MKALSPYINILQNNIFFKLYKHYIIDSILIVKAHGVRELFKRRGKKFVLVIFTYYLIRDSILYILIPYCVARGLL